MSSRPSIEVLFAPAEFARLPERNLAQTTAVVFDVLRATTSMVTALANGATAIVPVEGIEEALAMKRRDPCILLAGERNGWRIDAAQAGGIEFDLGNSPREFTRERVEGKRIAMTTTNGTRALRSCRRARSVLVGGLVNLEAVHQWLRSRPAQELLLVCGGTYEEAAFEDTLAAGLLANRLWDQYASGHVADSAAIARELARRWESDLPGAMANARNARRLLSIPELAEDVRWSIQADALPLVTGLAADGTVIRWGSDPGP